MSIERWAEAPAVSLLVGDGDAADRLADVQPGAVVRSLDAADCLTTPEFLRAIAAALDFPDGPVNWNVVEERLSDLTWLPEADAYVVVVRDAERFTEAESAFDLTVLDSVFGALAGYEYSSPRRLVCQCAPDRLDELSAFLADHGLAWPPLA